MNVRLLAEKARVEWRHKALGLFYLPITDRLALLFLPLTKNTSKQKPPAINTPLRLLALGRVYTCMYVYKRISSRTTTTTTILEIGCN